MFKPVNIVSFGINGFEYLPQIVDYISNISYRTYLSGRANTLDFSLELLPDLVEPTTIESTDIVGVRVSNSDMNDPDILVTKNCVIDQKELNLFTNSYFYGSQSYNYGLQLSSSASDLGTDTTETEVNVGGTFGDHAGEWNFPDAFLKVITELKLTGYSASEYNKLIQDAQTFGTFEYIGVNDSRASNKGVWGNSWSEVLDKMCLMYGYIYQIETSQSTIDINAASITIKQYNDLMVSPTAKVINMADILRQSKFYRDWTNSYQKFIVKYPIWDQNAFGVKSSETYILTAKDNRVPSNIKGVKSVMNEGFLWGYDYYLDNLGGNNRPDPGDSTQWAMEAANALPRIRGLLWEYNNRNFKCDFSVPGSGNLIAGKVIELTGFPSNTNINGKWLIEEASHNIDAQSGWITNVKGFKIEFYTVGQGSNSDIQWTQQKYSEWESNPA